MTCRATTERERPGVRTLKDWLGADHWMALKRAHVGKQPFALPGVTAHAARDCRWSMLDEALAGGQADVLVVRQGRSLSCPPPRSLSDVRALFREHAGIALRRAEHASVPAKQLARSVSEDVPGALRVIVFATPAGTYGFGWHFDSEEVFIVQTEGTKTYYLRANTVLPSSAEPCEASFAAYASETSPLLACELHAGDFLYVPRCWWHMAVAHRASLSVSIGVLPAV